MGYNLFRQINAFAPRKDDVVRSEKEALEDLAKYETPKKSGLEPTPFHPHIYEDGDHIVFEGIGSYNPDFDEYFEYYNKLFVKKTPLSVGSNDTNFGTPTNLRHSLLLAEGFESDYFVPSYALMCNMLYELTQKAPGNRNVKSILDKYFSLETLGSFMGNTIMNWHKDEACSVLHYPYELDAKEVNKNKQDVLITFNLSPTVETKIRQYDPMCSFDMFKDDVDYLFQAVTGLQDIDDLVSIGNYFQRKPVFSVNPKVGKEHFNSIPFIDGFTQNHYRFGLAGKPDQKRPVLLCKGVNTVE